MAGEVPFSDLNFSADDFTWNLSDFSSSDNWTTFTYSDQFQKIRQDQFHFCFLIR